MPNAESSGRLDPSGARPWSDPEVGAPTADAAGKVRAVAAYVVSDSVRRRRRDQRNPIAGQLQDPPGLDHAGVHEARTVGHGAAQVQRRDGGPVAAVTQLRLGDRPERVARVHDVGGRTERLYRRSRCATTDVEVHPCRWPTVVRRAARCAGLRGHEQRRSHRDQRQHSGRDPRGDPLRENRTDRGGDVTPADLRHDGSGELCAAGEPGHPRHECHAGEDDPGRRSPLMPEPVPEGVADDGDQHRRDRRENEKRGQERAQRVDDAFLPRVFRCSLTHLPARSSTYRRSRRIGPA